MNEFIEIRQKVLKITRTASEIYDIPRFINTLIEQVFLRSGRFIMEFIQNAEDACMEAVRMGTIRYGILRITLYNDKIVIMHNGKPFDKEDLFSLCGLKSRKKPEEGYLGYLGIGFKSVFKVSDKVVIYSRGDKKYCFKFDRSAWKENDPWWSLPIELPESSLEVTLPNKFTTMFIVYLKSKEFYDQLRESLENLRYPVFLFLRYIKEIEIYFGQDLVRRIKIWPSREEKVRELEVKEVPIIESGQENLAYEFLVFRKTFDVPEHIRMDDLTIKVRRDNVKRREVSVAFLLKNGRLTEIKGEPVSGFYSFLPIEEARTGLKFLIQADFITQAGREQVALEAKWNKWMMERIADVVEEAIGYFQKDPKKYCAEYLALFEIEDSYDDFYELLVKPILKHRIDRILEDPLVPTQSGELVPLSKAVKLTSEVAELVERNIIDESDLALIFGENDLKFIAEDIKTGQKHVKILTLSDLLFNKNLIKAKGVNFLIEVYKHANELGKLPSEGAYVLDSSGQVVLAGVCYFNTLPEDVKELIEKYPDAKAVLKEYKFIHPKLEEIKGILRKVGVNYISYGEICKKALLPRLLVDSNPEKENLTSNSVILIATLLKKGNVYPTGPIWVLARDGEIKRSDEVYLFDRIFGELNQFNKIILNFDEYLDKDEDVDSWRTFFEQAEVKLIDDYCRDFLDFIIEIIKKVNDKENVVELTYVAKEVWKYGSEEIDEIPVLTMDGKIVGSSKCYISSVYRPKEDWMKWKDLEGFDIGPFIAEDYISYDQDVEGWREFFKAAGAKDCEGNREVIGSFAEAFAKSKLKVLGYKIVGGRGEGYDLIVEKNDETLYVEVKGRKDFVDIGLDSKQARKALDEKEKYCIVVVYNIPNNPEMYILKNPADNGGIVSANILLKVDVIKEKGERIV